ncbi:hypothetical protein J6590_072969 [Homalodisca vitripennis]|nr:hypothetical protein J6590_072969 [Homalodisca vitripennis]
MTDAALGTVPVKIQISRIGDGAGTDYDGLVSVRTCVGSIFYRMTANTRPTHVSGTVRVEVFSEGWVPGPPTRHDIGYTADSPQARSVLVEFLPREPGLYSVTWMEISRRALYPHADLSLSDCLHRCPELDACINSSLWCDGVSHCPSGFDEALTHCLYLLQLPPLHLALVLLGLLVMAATLLYVLCRLCRARHGSRLKSLPSDTEAIVGTPKEVIC